MTKRTRQPRPQPAVKAEPRAPMRLAWDAVMPAESVASSPFEIYKPMPGVIPDGGRTMAMDSNIGNAYTWAQQMSSIYDEGLQFLGYQQLSAMSQRAEYRRPAEIIAREMTRKGWKLQVTGEDDKSKKIDAIEEEFDRLKLTHTITKAVEQDGLFGRSQIFLDLGDDTASPDGRKELITPLKLDDRKLGKGAIKRLTVIEPLWTYPNDYNSNNPFDPTFFKPQTWFVMGTEIHATRLLTIIGRPVSDLLKPAYAFGGLSLTQMAKPYVDNWLRTRQSVSDLLHSFSVMGLKTNLGEILNGGAAEMLRKRVQLFNQTRDNRGLMVLDKETEELFNVSTSLGSLDHLQAQAQEHQSAVTGIPLSILLGITPSGLNASSEGEIRTFYAWVHAQQESVLGEPLNYILKAVQLSLFGEIDPKITLAFEPLWAMDDKELAEVRKTEADTDAIYLQQGVITQQESRARLAGQEDSPYMGLDLSVDLPEPQGSPADEGDPLKDDDGEDDDKPAQDGDPDQKRDEDGKFAPVAHLSGTELHTDEHPELTPDNVVDAARVWFKKNLQEKYRDGGLALTGGGNARVSGKSWKEIKRGLKSDILKAKLLPAIEAIVARGNRSELVKPHKDREDAAAGFHYFDGRVRVGDTIHHAQVDVMKDHQGDLVYHLWRDVDAKKQKAPNLPRSRARGEEPSAEDSANRNASIDDSGDEINITILGSWPAPK